MTRRLSNCVLRTSAALLAIVLLSSAAAEAPALQPFDAVYDVRIKGLRGEMSMSLAEDGDALTARSLLRARGFASLLARGQIEEFARFTVTENALKPAAYRSSDTLGSNDTTIEMQFDWPAARADGSEDGEPFEHPVADHTYDRVTLQYGLMHDLLNDRLAEHYTLLDGHKFKELTVTNLGEQRIEVPFGTYDVVGIAHQSANSSRVTTLWCAPALGFLPVRIEQHRKGKLNVRADLSEYTPATPGMSAAPR